MGSRGVVAGRARWIAVFAVLLLASSAVPVFAADPPSEPSGQAFADLSVAEAQELLLNVFSQQPATLNADPARYLSDAKVLEIVDCRHKCQGAEFSLTR